MKALVEGGEVIEALRERILGRTVAADVVNPETQETLYYADVLLGEDEVEQIELLGIDEVKVRTPLTCDTRYGLCAPLLRARSGSRPPRQRRRGGGRHRRAVDRRAGNAAHDAHVPHRRRGVAYRGGLAARKQVGGHDPLLVADALRHQRAGASSSSSRARARVTIHDDNGRERERHKVPYGATLQVKDGDVVKAGKVLAMWDATSRPIVTEYAGRVKFENVEEGVTVAKQVDEVTGLSTLVVIDPKRARRRGGQGRAAAGEAARREGRRDQARRARTCRSTSRSSWARSSPSRTASR